MAKSVFVQLGASLITFPPPAMTAESVTAVPRSLTGTLLDPSGHDVKVDSRQAGPTEEHCELLIYVSTRLHTDRLPRWREVESPRIPRVTEAQMFH